MAQTTLKRHPIRAALWGLILGLGVFVYLTFVWPVILLDNVTNVALKGAVVVVGVMVLATLWGLFGPAKKPKGMAPVAAAAPPAPWADAAPPPPMEEAPPAPAGMSDQPPPEGE